MWSQIEPWWQARTPRERALLLAAGGLLLALLVYALVWKPVHSAHERALKRAEAAERQWQWLNGQIAAHPELLQRPKQGLTVEKARLWLEELNRGLRLGGEVQVAQGRVVLRFERAPASAVAGLLNRLQRQSVQVVRMRLEQVDGGVRGELEVAP